ncbi:hypothetical protein [Terrisporobacter petrolearius]|uniref:hypothetical protein n=1 Tax=Terrisporobacter petrolearius TaxID=1460447 RepID=UPI003B00B3EF
MKYRVHGEEQPCFPLGPFRVRLPFIHYRWEWPEALQAILMCSTCLGAITVLTEVLGVPFEIAWSMVIINGLLYNLHSLLGDPVVPGWVTPAIPLVVSFLGNYTFGVERIQALIAMQILVGIIFLIMGITGLAGKLIKILPNSIKAGILLGAGIAAVFGEFQVEGRFGLYPISIAIGAILSYLILFSDGFISLKKKNKFCAVIGKYGMVSAIIVAVIVGPLVGEIPIPKVEVGSFIKIPDFAGLIKTVSPFGIGFPSVSLFISTVPMAIIAYIIAFGDFITGEALIAEAGEVRKDEKIDFDSNRSNLISGMRNIVMALMAPYIQLCGPLSASVTAAVAQRYKDGRNQMDSIFSGAGTFRWVTFAGVSLVPIVSLFQPVLPIALSLMLIVQGYICTRIAMGICKNDTDRGVAGVMGAVLAAKGATWGLAIGIILHLILRDFTKKKIVEKVDKIGA